MKYYAVRVGWRVGVYTTWNDCQQQVNGYKGAQYKAFNTMKEALDFIGNPTPVPTSPPAVMLNSTPMTTQPITIITHQPTPLPFNQQIQYPQPKLLHPVNVQPTPLPRPTPYPQTVLNPNLVNVLYVDGGQNKQTGPDAWSCCVNGAGVDMIAQYSHLLPDMILKDVTLPVGNRRVIVAHFSGAIQQNNGAELLAMIAGLRIALSTRAVKTIFSDSDLCVKYWSISLGDQQRRTLDPRKVAFIDNLIALRKEFDKMGGAIIKISGDNNLADLGYH